MLRAVNNAWEKDCREVYSRILRQELEVEFSQMKDAERAVRDTLGELTDKGLLDKRKTTLEGKGDVVLFPPMELIFLSPIHRLYGNTLRTLRTLRTLLNAYNPRKALFTFILFPGKVQRVKGVRRVFLQSPAVMS